MLFFKEEKEDKIFQDELDIFINDNKISDNLIATFQYNAFNISTLNERGNNNYNKENIDFKFLILNDKTNTASTNNTYNEIDNSIIKDNKNAEFNLLFFKKQIELRSYIYNKITNPLYKSGNLIGRKRNNSQEMRPHNKFSDDNLIIKIKVAVVDNLLYFINKLLIKEYGNDKKQLLKLNSKILQNSKIDYNIKFLEQTLKVIFSNKISIRYRNKNSDYNKNLIKYLLNEKDLEKRILFTKLFNLNFLECLKHFRKDLFFKELDGLKLIDDCYKKFEGKSDYKMYKDIFGFYVKNFEEILKLKKPRKSKNSKNENDI